MRITNNQQDMSFQKNLIVTFTEDALVSCNQYTEAMNLAKKVSGEGNPAWSSFPFALDRAEKVLLVPDATTPLGKLFDNVRGKVYETKQALSGKLSEAENSLILAPINNLRSEIAKLIQKDKATTVHMEYDVNGVVEKSLWQRVFG